MNFLTKFLDSIAPIILKPSNWERIKHIVERAENTNLSGKEKLEFALDEAKIVGIELATQLLYIGIVLAVSVLFPNLEFKK